MTQQEKIYVELKNMLNKFFTQDSDPADVLEAMLRAYPVREFFQMLIKWSRIKKGDYATECY